MAARTTGGIAALALAAGLLAGCGIPPQGAPGSAYSEPRDRGESGQVIRSRDGLDDLDGLDGLDDLDGLDGLDGSDGSDGLEGRAGAGDRPADR